MGRRPQSRRLQVLFRVLDPLAFGRSRMGLGVTLGYELAILRAAMRHLRRHCFFRHFCIPLRHFGACLRPEEAALNVASIQSRAMGTVLVSVVIAAVRLSDTAPV